MGSQKTTQQGSAGPMSPEIQRLMAMLEQVATGAAGQMGDLSSLAKGDLSATPGDMALINQAQESSGNVARSQASAGLEDMLRQLEENTVGRGIAGSSVEAVNNAVVGRDYQRQLMEQLDKQRAEGAQAQMNMPFQRAGAQLSANQMLLQRLTGITGQMLPYDAGVRGLNATQTTTEPFDVVGMMNALPKPQYKV